MALLILVAALWGIVLLPTLLKRRTQRRQVGSIDHFHHQLHLLEQAGPKIVAPAYRLETAQSQGGMAVGASGYPAISSSSARPNLVLLRPVAPGQAGEDEVIDDATGDHYQRVGTPSRAGLAASATEPASRAEDRRRELPTHGDAEAARRREARLRRRNFLALLVGTMVFTGLLGLVPSLHGLWVVTVMSVVGLAGYVTLAAMAMRNDLAVPSVGALRGVGRSRRVAAHAAPFGMGAEIEDAGRRSRAVAGYPGAWDELDQPAGAGGPHGSERDAGADDAYVMPRQRVAAR